MMSEFVPLRKKLRRVGTGEEDNFVASYLPESLRTANTTEGTEEITALHWRHGINVTGENCPPPFESFSQLQLQPELMAVLAECQYTTPTPVQMQAIPCILAGRDVTVLAETGSGKTLAYTLPLCALLSLFSPARPGESPRALILAPTRELAQQIHGYVHKFISSGTPKGPIATQSKYSTLLVCGGIPMKPLEQSLKMGVDVVVATPGKLIGLLDKGELSLDAISYLVIDEVDRFMKGMMEDDLRKIISAATSSLRPRQTLLFSATLPENLERLVRSAVLNPITVEVGSIGVTTANLEQDVIFMHAYQKQKQLLETLRGTEFPPVLVFCNSIQGVDEVVQLLRREQFHVAGLHSDKSQETRFKITDAMRKGGVDVLVATDVASRGIDIPGITHVINYDLPNNIDDYVHRCGRTARLQSKGKATSFLTLDCKIATELRDLLTSLDKPIPAELENVKQFGKKVLRTELGDRIVD